MPYAHPELIQTFDAPAAIAKFRICKFGSNDGEAAQSTANTDAFIGVSDLLGTQNDRVEIARGGVAKVEYGAAVVRGDWLTADSNGKAIKAAPAAASSVNVIGLAEVSGASGDIGAVLLSFASIAKAKA